MNEFLIEATGELLPVELWRGAHYHAVWQMVRSLADSDELAWDAFSEILTQLLLRRNVTGYPLGQIEPDDAPDADENLSWPFSEEDELRHRRLLLLQAQRRVERQLAELGG